ncbi:MAG: ribosomal protein S18-alanine N-acetyltransferase [candidate division WOR-3 bacterium]
MKIERMQTKDLEEVMAIEKVSFKLPWKKSYFLYDLNRPNAYCLVAKENDKLVGYLIAWKINNELHLANIAVHPNERRKGIGSQLLKTILEIGKELRCKNIFLEVRESNIVAQNFYRKFGFVHILTQKNYYHDGEDALILEKRF